VAGINNTMLANEDNSYSSLYVQLTVHNYRTIQYGNNIKSISPRWVKLKRGSKGNQSQTGSHGPRCTP